MKVSIDFYYKLYYYYLLIVIDTESDTESPPAEYSDWDGFSNTSFDSAFTDNHTDSEPEGTIDTSWLYTTVKEQEEDIAQRRYLRRRGRHIQERDQRRLARELEEVAEDYFDIWVEQDQDQGQDIRPQKRQYSSELVNSEVDSDRRYPLRKHQLTPKAAALILE